MGCNCGKNKRRRQSSRMNSNPTPKKIRNITIPTHMTPNQRRSTIVKINNIKKAEERKKTVADYVNQRKTR